MAPKVLAPPDRRPPAKHPPPPTPSPRRPPKTRSNPARHARPPPPRRETSMVLSDISIRRPVFATVINLVVLLVGIIAYDRLAVRQIPNVDTPVVTVNTSYPGASAQVIESQVTQPIEDALSGVEGIEYMQSVSREQSSQVTLRFKLDRDPDGAASDVRDRVAQARQRLPDEVDEPIVQKQEADAE